MLHPGDAATMDYRPERYAVSYSTLECINAHGFCRRLNVHVDENEVIQKANCG